MKGLADEIKSIAERFSENKESLKVCPSSGRFFTLVRDKGITSEQLEMFTEAFYNSPYVKNFYSKPENQGKMIDPDCEKKLYGLAKEIIKEDNMLKLVKRFPIPLKKRFVEYLLRKEQDNIDKVIDYLQN